MNLNFTINPVAYKNKLLNVRWFSIIDFIKETGFIIKFKCMKHCDTVKFLYGMPYKNFAVSYSHTTGIIKVYFIESFLLSCNFMKE